MKLSEQAARYAGEHPQRVRLAWIDNSVRTYTAGRAVELCAVPKIAACIIGAQAQDDALSDMLNKLLDDG